MYRAAILATSLFLMLTSGASAQSVSARVTGVASGAGSVAGQATTGVTGSAGYLGQGSNGASYSSGSVLGGDLPGGYAVKLGDKVIKLRGDIGVGSDSSNFRAGVGIPF